MTENDYIGTTIDEKYAVISLIGTGGMGTVYLARHVALGKNVAIKLLHTEFLQKDEIVKRFYREAQAAAEINHPNVTDVIDLGVSSNGQPYIVMEHLEGESLAQMLNRTGPIDLGAACGILEPILKALNAAHSKGVVHRDLKPDNIFLVHQRGTASLVKVIDFGVSKFMGHLEQKRLTVAGTLLGTPAYMSPEQIRGLDDVDQRTDLYAVGVMLYEMLVGKLPFPGSTPLEQMEAALTKPLIPLQRACPTFPMEVEPLITQTLSKKPVDRPQTALVMLTVLSRVSAFEKRNQSLKKLSSYFSAKTELSLDFKPPVQPPKHQAASNENSYLKKVRQGAPPRRSTDTEMTPRPDRTEAWTSTDPSSDNRFRGRLSGHLGNRRNLVVLGAVGCAVVVTIGLLLVWLLGKTPEQAAPGAAMSDTPALPAAASTAQPTPAEVNVQIEVRGLPRGAKIFYDDLPIPFNPFRVSHRDIIVSLRVEADGHKPFVTSVVPSEDQVVTVEMQPNDAIIGHAQQEEAAAPKVVPSATDLDTKANRADSSAAPKTSNDSQRTPRRPPKRRGKKAKKKPALSRDIIDPWG